MERGKEKDKAMDGYFRCRNESEGGEGVLKRDEAGAGKRFKSKRDASTVLNRREIEVSVHRRSQLTYQTIEIKNLRIKSTLPSALQQ